MSLSPVVLEFDDWLKIPFDLESGLKPDAPQSAKDAYAEFLKESAEMKRLGIKA